MKLSAVTKFTMHIKSLIQSFGLSEVLSKGCRFTFSLSSQPNFSAYVRTLGWGEREGEKAPGHLLRDFVSPAGM